MCLMVTYWVTVWDHPREYGENQNQAEYQTLRAGSSPRIRGKSTLAFEKEIRIGIIPANTGKIGQALHRVRGLRDHPREYGENAC